MSAPTEYEDLNLHVSICQERYQQLNVKFEQLDSRLTAVEVKVDALSSAVKDSQTTTMRALIAATVTIITTIISTIGVVAVAVL